MGQAIPSRGDTVRLHYRRNGHAPAATSCPATVLEVARQATGALLTLEPADPGVGVRYAVPELGVRFDGLGWTREAAPAPAEAPAAEVELEAEPAPESKPARKRRRRSGSGDLEASTDGGQGTEV